MGDINAIKRLNEQQRIQAWEAAKTRVAGDEPDPKNFKVRIPSKYPWYLQLIVVLLCLIVLVAAFIPSAFHLHDGGATEFCRPFIGGSGKLDITQAVENRECSAVGYSTVLLAETGQLVFLLALAVLASDAVTTIRIRNREFKFNTTRTVLWLGTIAATMIALVGNIHAGQPWLYGNWALGYLLTIIPPLLVMGVGYVLKELMLHAVSRRHEYNVKLQNAKDMRLKILEDPTVAGERWLRAYSIALRDMIREVNNRRKDALMELTGDDWKYLIKLEMLAADFIVHPDRQTDIEIRIEREENVRRLQLEAQKAVPPGENGILVHERVLPAKAARKRKEEPVIIGDEEVWLNDSVAGTWTARSKLSGKVLATDLESEKAARKRVQQYNYHWNRRNGGNN